VGGEGEEGGREEEEVIVVNIFKKLICKKKIQLYFYI
jgi:hypothetical protein